LYSQKNKVEAKKNAIKNGNFETVRKTSNPNGSKMYKLDNEEIGKIEKVSLKLGQIVLKARNGKGWSQKELAQKIGGGLNTKIIQEIENNTAKKDGALLVKIQRVLGVKLTGKPETWGQPLNKK
jgi:ribosome-binding protein aMBF1 (putative translation factor)